MKTHLIGCFCKKCKRSGAWKMTKEWKTRVNRLIRHEFKRNVESLAIIKSQWPLDTKRNGNGNNDGKRID